MNSYCVVSHLIKIDNSSWLVSFFRLWVAVGLWLYCSSLEPSVFLVRAHMRRLFCTSVACAYCDICKSCMCGHTRDLLRWKLLQLRWKPSERSQLLHIIFRLRVKRSFGNLSAQLSRIVFTVRRYALHGICYSNSVCPSVRLSVRLSVCHTRGHRLVDCVHMVRPTIMISSPYGSPIILVSGDITFIPINSQKRCAIRQKLL